MYLTSPNAWTFSLSHDPFSSTSMTPMSTLPAGLITKSGSTLAITASVVWWCIATIAPFAISFTFLIWMWPGAFYKESSLLNPNAISWSILVGRQTLSSLLCIRRLSAMLDPVFGVGPGLADSIWRCVWGWNISRPRMAVGIGIGFGSCCGWDCYLSCSVGLGFGCCCSWRFLGSLFCLVPACCEASSPVPCSLAVLSHSLFPACWANAALPALALASIFAVISVMPVPHSMLCFWQLSQSVSICSSHSFMPSHCISSCATCSYNILAILVTVWCSCVTLHTCCVIVLCIWLPLSPRALADSDVSLLSLFPILIWSHSSLAAMVDMRVEFPDIAPIAPLASPASAIFISVSIWGVLTIPSIELWCSWMANMASLHVIVASPTPSTSSCRPWGLDVSIWG